MPLHRFNANAEKSGADQSGYLSRTTVPANLTYHPLVHALLHLLSAALRYALMGKSDDGSWWFLVPTGVHEVVRIMAPPMLSAPLGPSASTTPSAATVMEEVVLSSNNEELQQSPLLAEAAHRDVFVPARCCS